MDDLIVIILTLLVAGAGAIGQIRKKRQTPEAPESQKNPDNIWDLFKEEVFPQELKAEPEYAYIEQQETEPYENEQGYKFEAKNEGGVIINKEIETIPDVKELTKEIKEGFSLRKAVIYSEILNRKYI